MTFKIYCDKSIFPEEATPESDFVSVKNKKICNLALLPIKKVRIRKTKTVYYSNEENIHNVEVAKNIGVKNIIGWDISKDQSFLKPYLNTIIIDKQFSPEYFLEKNAKKIKLEISTNTEINIKQEALLTSISEQISWDYHRDHFQIVLNELLTNALYNASGNNQTKRTNLIELQNISRVEVNCQFDDKLLICAVKDYYGILTWDKFITSLYRAMTEKAPETKKGGAGLGLYLMFSHCSSLAVNVKPGSYTEFFWILEKSKRQKDNLTRAKTLNFFEIK
jgi:hypothetical protein